MASREWQDETLIATTTMNDGKIKVVELPPQATKANFSRRSFKDHDQAERYIAKQWSTDILDVSISDITLEIEYRKANGL